MSSQPVTIYLTEGVRPVLVRLLRAALELPKGSRVVDSLPLNPWGNIEEFRRAVFLPLHGEEAPTMAGLGGVALTIEPDDVRPIRDVLDGLAESITGGTPWVAPSQEERLAVNRLLARVDDPASRAP
jgi:hypothetical protein